MRSFLIGSLCTAAFACGTTHRIDVCGRGDRVDIASYRLTALDQAGALLDQWTASADHASSTDGGFADGVRRLRVEGLDSGGAVVASGEAAVGDQDALCVCVASTVQQPVACDEVACRVTSGRCAFTDLAGAPLGPRTYGFGDNTTDEIHPATSDSYLDGEPTDQTQNYGGALVIKVKADPAAPKVGLWRFDLRAIPSTAQVTAAAFVVTTTDNATGSPVEVYAVLEDWEAGTGVNDVGCSNWTCRKAGAVPWTTAGVGAPGSSEAAPLLTIQPEIVNTRYETSSEALRQIVQRWVESPDDNHGLTARMPPSTSSVDLASSEAADGVRPELRVELVVP